MLQVLQMDYFRRPGLYFLAFVFSVFILFNPGKLVIDDYLRLVEAVMILNHGRLDIDPQYLPETGYAYYQSPDGRLFVYWGLISSMLYLPAALLGKICRGIFPFFKEIETHSGRSLLIERFVGSMVIMPSIMLMNVILFWRILQKYFDVADQRIVHLLLILAFFGTQLFKYSSGFEEGFMILLFLAAFILYEECRETWIKGLSIGTLAGLALNTRYYIGFPVLFLFVLWQGIQRRGFLQFFTLFTIGLFPYAVLFGLYNYVRCESLSPDAFFRFYVNHFSGPPNMIRSSISEIGQFFWDRVVGAKGLLVYNPVLILAPYGIITIFKDRILTPSRTRLLLFSCGVVVCYLVIHAALTMGSFDLASWGPRYLTATVPFLFLLTVPAILRMVGYPDGLKRNQLVRCGLAVLVGISFIIQVLGAIGWDETEMYQGHSTNHIVQRAQNIWNISLYGNPLAPHQNSERPLFTGKRIREITKDSLVSAGGFEVKRLYEGFSLWPVTLGYAFGWSTWKVTALILVNLAIVIFFGLRWARYPQVQVTWNRKVRQ